MQYEQGELSAEFVNERAQVWFTSWKVLSSVLQIAWLPLLLLLTLRKASTAALLPVGSSPAGQALLLLHAFYLRALGGIYLHPIHPLPTRFQQTKWKTKTLERLSLTTVYTVPMICFLSPSGNAQGAVPLSLQPASTFYAPPSLLCLLDKSKSCTQCSVCGRNAGFGKFVILGLNSLFCSLCDSGPDIHSLKVFMSLKIHISAEKNAWLGISG